MNPPEVEKALRSFFHAFASGETDALRKYLNEETYWEVPGRSRFSGRYLGPDACIRIIKARRERSEPPLRVFGRDVAVTDFHGVVMFAVTGHRDSNSFTSHEIVVAGYDDQDAFRGIHHYVYELNEFDVFWE